MNIEIQPKESLCDEKFNLIISGLSAKELVKVSASMHLPWALGVTYTSYAYFEAGKYGIIDLSEHKPISGTYDYVDSMGLVNSLKMPKGAKLSDIASDIAIDKSLSIQFTVESNEYLENIIIERPFLARGIKTEKIREKFVGDFFYHETSPKSTILILGGSDGSQEALLPIAGLLSSRNFNVLTIAYFNQKGLPKKLERIPLEYFDAVFDWLKSDSRTKDTELAVWGGSKGGELALLLASRHSFIKKVIAANPHGFCFQGVSFRHVSSWTLEGKDVPFIRLKNKRLLSDIFLSIVKNQPFGFCHTYEKGVEEAQNQEEARIKLENSQADILLFAGKKDNIWNSSMGCQVLVDKLKETKYPHQYSYVEYTDAGHPVFAPYIIPMDGLTKAKIFPRLTLSSGGTDTANALAQADMWQKTLEFLKN